MKTRSNISRASGNPPFSFFFPRGTSGERTEGRGNPQFPPRGYFLIECLVYLALFAAVLAVAMKGFSHCFDNYRAVRRNSDDIVRVLHVGEQWRADIRSATGPVQLTHDGVAEQLLIPSSSGNVVYSFDRGELHRKAAVPADEQRLLSNVRSSEMESSHRAQVTAWTWELELNPTRKDACVHPLFTFEAVAGPAKTP